MVRWRMCTATELNVKLIPSLGFRVDVPSKCMQENIKGLNDVEHFRKAYKNTHFHYFGHAVCDEGSIFKNKNNICMCIIHSLKFLLSTFIWHRVTLFCGPWPESFRIQRFLSEGLQERINIFHFKLTLVKTWVHINWLSFFKLEPHETWRSIKLAGPPPGTNELCIWRQCANFDLLARGHSSSSRTSLTHWWHRNDNHRKLFVRSSVWWQSENLYFRGL